MPAIPSRVETYESLEACAETLSRRHVDVELLQLGPGSGTVSLESTACQLLTVQRVRIDAPAVRRGSLNPQLVSFAIWDDRRPQDGAWCGGPLGVAGVSVFPNEFSAAGKHRLDGTVVEVEPARCLELASSFEIDLPADWQAGSGICPLERERVRRLSRDLATLENEGGNTDLEVEVLRTLVSTVARQRGGRPRATLRARAFAAARDHIAGSGQDVPTVPELSRVAGVSIRTLEYAFRERVGMTPVQYLKVYRLNRVRQMLRAGLSDTVVDAANAWGFWHMGKFASDYSKIYGVTPSRDLRR